MEHLLVYCFKKLVSQEPKQSRPFVNTFTVNPLSEIESFDRNKHENHSASLNFMAAVEMFLYSNNLNIKVATLAILQIIIK